MKLQRLCPAQNRSHQVGDAWGVDSGFEEDGKVVGALLNECVWWRRDYESPEDGETGRPYSTCAPPPSITIKALSLRLLEIMSSPLLLNGQPDGGGV